MTQPAAVSTASFGSASPTPASATARSRLLLEGPIFTTLLRLSAPNVLNLLAFVGVITFDGFFLGRIGTNALAGASLAFPWVMLVLQATNSGLGAGVSSAVARALGAGRKDRADALVFHAFLVAIALSALFSTAMWLGGPSIFRAMGGREEMLSDALAYSNVALGGAVCICVMNLLANAVRGTGNMSLPAGLLVATVILHIAISPALIFGWGPIPALGPAGAGLGLVIPFGLGSLFIIGYLRSRSAGIRLNFRGVAPRWEFFADILKVGVPGLLNTAITNLSVVLLTGIAGQFGAHAAIAYAMGARLEYIMQPVAFGFGTAIVTMVGTNWGARRYGRARRIGWIGALTIAAVCGSIGLVAALAPSLWLVLFTSDPVVTDLGTRYLRIVGPSYLCFGLGLGLFFVSQGLGLGFAAMSANAGRLVLSAAGALAAIHWLDAGMTGLFAAVALGFLLYAVVLVGRVLRIKMPA
jgi:putative MATE family efflux protein